MKKIFMFLLIALLCLPAVSAENTDQTIVIEDQALYFKKSDDSWKLCRWDGVPLLDHTWSDEDFYGGFSYPFDGFHGAQAAPIRFGAENSSTYGSIDADGKILIEPIYDSVSPYSDGYSAVRKEDRWAVADDTGRFTTEFQFEAIDFFSDGAAPACMDGKYGLIDPQGNFLAEPAYSSLNTAGSGLFIGWNKNGVCGIDNQGNAVIPPIYQSLSLIGENFLQFGQDEKFGILNFSGKILVPAQYDSLNHWADGSFSGILDDRTEFFTLADGKALPLSVIDHHYDEDRYAPFTGDLVPSAKALPAEPAPDVKQSAETLSETAPDAALPVFDALPRLRCTEDLLPLCSGLMQGFYPESATVLPICSHEEGLFGLSDGSCSLFLTARPSDAEGLRQTVIGTDALIFTVSAENPVSDLSSDDIRRIYSGEVTDWSEIGGTSGTILAYQRLEGSGAQARMLALTDGKMSDQPPMDVFSDGWSEASLLPVGYRNYPAAIGYCLRSRLEGLPADVKILSVDGVLPDETAIANGTYGLCLPVYAICGEDDFTDGMVNWLTSEAGKVLIRNSRLIP